MEGVLISTPEASGEFAVTNNSLSPASVTSGLETSFIGQQVICYPRLASTMEAAKQEAQRGAAEGTIIIAEEQTAGKGRMRRAWLSPRGSIALSVILYPEVNYLPSIIMLASLAVVYSIKTVTGLKPGIKWPNDVLIGDRKVCGILVESDVRGSRVDHTIIGIGINVNLRLTRFAEIAPTATSLSDELGREVPRLEITRQLLVEIEKLYLTLRKGGSVYEEWRDNLLTLGKQVQVTWGDTVSHGTAESVARDGSLLLRQQDGSLNRIVAGDVTLRQ